MRSWFPCACLDEIQTAQSLAAARRLNAIAASIACVMGAALAAQVSGGFGWAALAWQLVMATLACLAASRRIRASARRRALPAWFARVDGFTVFAAAYGLCCALAVVVWGRAMGAGVSVLVLVASLTQPAYAVVACYFLPTAVVAFSLPLFAASLVFVEWTLPQPAAQLGIGLVAAHGGGLFWFLRSNWNRFVQTVGLNAEKARLAGLLKEQQEIAERAGFVKARFLAAASHDLRQPMHAISLYLSGVSELALPERVRSAIENARECARDVGDMFSSLLDISRLDAHEAVPSLSAFSIGTVLSRVQQEFDPLARARGVQLRVRHRDDPVYSDPVMVERIALNFVSNAVRHAAGGKVLVACRRRGRILRLAVHDTGEGIPESQQQAIFDDFHRLDTRRNAGHSGRLGLGLAIVGRLAQTLQVPVLVRSTPQRGSMFAIDLPMGRVQVPTEQTALVEARLMGKLVVLVDDEPSILLAATFILEKAGCTVLSAHSGEAILASVATCQRVPDAIVCDYELHEGCKGTDIIRALREEFNNEIPALLVTGDTGPGPAEAAAREMGLVLLHKPLESTVLRQSLGAVLC